MPSKVRPPEPGIIPLQWRGHVEAREIKSTTYAVLGLFLSNGEVTLKQIAFANTFQPMERIIPLQWRGHVEAIRGDRFGHRDPAGLFLSNGEVTLKQAIATNDG